jgi:hypothetical protein
MIAAYVNEWLPESLKNNFEISKWNLLVFINVVVEIELGELEMTVHIKE